MMIMKRRFEETTVTKLYLESMLRNETPAVKPAM